MADDARERREARRKRILQSGADRLRFITESSGSLRRIEMQQPADLRAVDESEASLSHSRSALEATYPSLPDPAPASSTHREVAGLAGSSLPSRSLAGKKEDKSSESDHDNMPSLRKRQKRADAARTMSPESATRRRAASPSARALPTAQPRVPPLPDSHFDEWRRAFEVHTRQASSSTGPAPPEARRLPSAFLGFMSDSLALLARAAQQTVVLRSVLALLVGLSSSLSFLFTCCSARSDSSAAHCHPSLHPILVVVSAALQPSSVPSWLARPAAPLLRLPPLLAFLAADLSLLLSLAALQRLPLFGAAPHPSSARASAASAAAFPPAGPLSGAPLQQLLAVAGRLREAAAQAALLYAVASAVAWDAVLLAVAAGCLLALGSPDWGRPEAACVV